MLERHKNDCFEINGKQMNKMSKKGGTAKFEKKKKKKKKKKDWKNFLIKNCLD